MKYFVSLLRLFLSLSFQLVRRCFLRAKFNPFVWNRKLCFLFRVKKNYFPSLLIWPTETIHILCSIGQMSCVCVCVCLRVFVFSLTYLQCIFPSLSFRSLSLLSSALFLSHNKFYCQNQLFPNECCFSFGKIHFLNLSWILLSFACSLAVPNLFASNTLPFFNFQFVPEEKIQSIT